MAAIPHFSLLCLCVLAHLPAAAHANVRYLRTVAFSAQRTLPVPASLTNAVTVGEYGTVVRPDANHFDPARGVFTAPLRGIYAFSFSFHQALITSSSRTDTSWIKLVQQGAGGSGPADVVIAEGPAAPVDSPISVPASTVILELDEGEKVYLATADRVDATASRPISFSGYLLTRL